MFQVLPLGNIVVDYHLMNSSDKDLNIKMENQKEFWKLTSRVEEHVSIGCYHCVAKLTIAKCFICIDFLYFLTLEHDSSYEI